MTMHLLKRLDIKGFKSIKDASIELRPLNILIGANGSGKSNLISFFKMMSNMAARNLQGFIGTSGGANALLHYGAKTTPQMEATLQLDAPKNMVSQYHVRLAHAFVDTLVFEEEKSFGKTKDQEGTVFGANLGPGRRETEMLPKEGSWVLAESSTGDVSIAAAFHMSEILRSCRIFQFQDTSDSAPIRLTGDIDQNQRLLNDGRNLAAFLYMLQKTQPKSYESIVDTIRLIVPFFGDFALAPLRVNPRSIQLWWKERDHDYDFGPHQLSDGTLRAMALVTLLMQPEADMPRIILIDEPELGLHPYAITILASLLKTASHHSQVIVATESPALLSHFDPADVVVTERCMGETTFRRCEEAELKEWLDEYTLGQLWEKNVLGGGPSR
jgi:predicted ATPase